MKRRSFLNQSAKAFAGLSVSTTSYAATKQNYSPSSIKVCTSIENENIYCHIDKNIAPIRIIHIADTHLFKDDERGRPFRKYSKRMAGAYNQTTHFKTGEKTHPEEAFKQTLALAKEVKADLITLVGDIFSFPSEAAVEWVMEKLKQTGIPYIYIAGNHDWHYEGMEGSLEELRDRWIVNRLLPLYQGNHPLMAAYDISGIRFVAIDNSTYQINQEQLDFFTAQVNSEKPMVLLVHIPMYSPGRNISFGCGNPYWGASTDRGYTLERRPPWPDSGHSQTTFDFYKQVFNAPNLLAVFTGHIHQKSVEIIKGKPQIVADDNASGAYLDIKISAMTEKERSLL